MLLAVWTFIECALRFRSFYISWLAALYGKVTKSLGLVLVWTWSGDDSWTASRRNGVVTCYDFRGSAAGHGRLMQN